MIKYGADSVIGDKAIVYGAGNVGLQVMEFLRGEGINIVGVIDKRNVGDTIQQVPVLDVQCIKDYSFDCVVIGSVVANTVNEIRDNLMSLGVERDKIVLSSPLIKDGDDDGYNLCNNPKGLIDMIFLYNKRNLSDDDVKEYTTAFRYLIYRLEDKKSFVDLLHDSLYDEKIDIYNRIVCGVILFEMRELTSEDNKKLISLVYELEDDEMSYIWFLSKSIAFYEQAQKKVVYRGEGRDRHKINTRIVQKYHFNKDIKKKGPKDIIEKVVVIIPELIGYAESASIYYRYLANALAESIESVKLIVATCSQDKAYALFQIDDGYKKSENDKWRELNRCLINSSVEIEYIESSIGNTINKIYDSVEVFDPDCVVDATDENIPISLALINSYHIFYYPMRTCTSGYAFDRTSMRFFERNEEVLGKQCVLPKARISLPPRHKYGRKDYLGLKEGSFVVISVGSRFYYEFDTKLVQKMIGLLRECQNMYWVIVGVTRDKKTGYFDDSADDVMNRIIFLKREEDVPALYQLCDVFLNPDRVGGGFSILFAMEQGLAIAALEKNKRFGAAWCGDENLVQGDYTELCEYIRNLYSDNSYLKKEQLKMLQKYNTYMGMNEWGRVFLRELYSMVGESPEYEGLTETI